MHDHPAQKSGSDHVRLLALRPRRGFGARAVIGIMEGGQAPAADNLVRADGRRHFGRHAGSGATEGDDENDGRLMLPHAPRNIVSAEAIPRLPNCGARYVTRP